jgi:hypothetical protein
MQINKLKGIIIMKNALLTGLALTLATGCFPKEEASAGPVAPIGILHVSNPADPKAEKSHGTDHIWFQATEQGVYVSESQHGNTFKDVKSFRLESPLQTTLTCSEFNGAGKKILVADDLRVKAGGLDDSKSTYFSPTIQLENTGKPKAIKSATCNGDINQLRPKVK